MRDNEFLKNRLDALWDNFSDVEKKNEVLIRFKGRWKNKFGHIKKLKDGSSEIVINGYFKNENIPEYVIDLTIAHELVHYSHGFNSPLPKLYNHPHKGGIVNRELKKRGFSSLILLEKRWVKNEWQNMIKQDFKPRDIKKSGLFRWF